MAENMTITIGNPDEQPQIEAAGYSAVRQAIRHARDQGETTLITDREGLPLAAIVPAGQARAITYGHTGREPLPDPISRIALLFAVILTADGMLSQAAADVLPGRPGNVTCRQHIENWLREAS